MDAWRDLILFVSSALSLEFWATAVFLTAVYSMPLLAVMGAGSLWRALGRAVLASFIVPGLAVLCGLARIDPQLLLVGTVGGVVWGAFGGFWGWFLQRFVWRRRREPNPLQVTTREDITSSDKPRGRWRSAL